MLKTNGPLQLFPLLRIIVFLIGGIVVGDLFYGQYNGDWLLAVFALLLVVLVFVRHHALWSGACLGALVACVGVLLVHFKRLDAAQCQLGVPVTYQALVVSLPKDVGKVVRCRLLIVRSGGEPVKSTYQVNATILKDKCEERWRQLSLGCGLEVQSVLTAHESQPFISRFNYRRWAEANDIYANSFILPADWQRTDANRLYALLPVVWQLRLRMQLWQQLLGGAFDDMSKDGEAGRLLRAVVLGDKSGLSRTHQEAFSVAGVSHVLALSGLHLGIVYAFLFVLLSQLLRLWRHCSWQPMLVQLILLLAIWGYVLLVGMSSSIVRSAVMLSVYSVVSLLSRDKMSVNTLAFTGIIMLLSNPLLVWDVSFQLSFAAVLSIFIFYPFIYSVVAHRTSFRPLLSLWALISVSVAAQVGTAPLVAYYFGRFSNYFLLSNLLVVPLITVVLYIGLLLLLLHVVVGTLTFLPSVLSWLTHVLMNIVGWVASFPYASIENIWLTPLQVVLLYLLIGCGYGLCRYLRKMVHFHRQFRNQGR